MPSGRPKEFDRDAVLERAMNLFWERGYYAVGLTDLLSHMGIARQSLYDTYGNKRQLFLGSVERYYETRLWPVQEILEGDGSPVANIQSAMDCFGRLVGGEKPGGCMIANSLVEFAAHDAGICVLLRKYLTALEEALCSALQRAQSCGETGSARPPRELAGMLFTSMLGLAMKARMGMSEYDVDAAGRGAMQLLTAAAT